MARDLLNGYGRSRNLLGGRYSQMGRQEFDPYIFTTTGGSLIDPTIDRSGLGVAPTWYWGDTNDSTGDSVSHNYSGAGSYDVEWTLPPENLVTLDFSSDEITHINTSQYWTRLTSFKCSNNDLTNLTLFSSLVGISTLECNGNNLTSLDLHESWTILTTLLCDNNSLTSLRIPGSMTNLTLCITNDNNLSASAIDDLLIDLDANGKSAGVLHYHNNPGAPDGSRSSEGATAKANLISKSWTVKIA